VDQQVVCVTAVQVEAQIKTQGEKMKKAVLLMVLIAGISVGALAQFKGGKFGAIPEALTVKTGTVVVQFTINVQTAGLASGYIGCQAFVGLWSSTYGTQYGEDDASSEAVISGNTATCSVNVPYSWSVQASNDYMIINAGVVAGPTVTQPTNLTVCGSQNAPGPGCVTGFPGRIALKAVGQYTVPSNGSTTVKTVSFHI
jgi:hypothetical protein